MVLPQHCHRRLPPSTLLLLLGLLFPTSTISFLPAPLHNPHACNKLHRSMSPNLQDERSEAGASPSFWQRLFPSDPTLLPPGKKEQELEALAARVQALEQQHQAELSVLRQQLEEQQEEQEEQQQQSKKEDGQGLRYSGTWTVELTGENYVHCTPAFNLGGFSFRVVLTEKKKEDDDDMRLMTEMEGESTQEKGEGGRPVGVYLEYLPSSNTVGGATAAVPCVQCRFEMLKDGKQGKGGRERGEERMYQSGATFLEADGGALGLDDFTHVWDHCPPPPLSVALPQQQQRPQQQHQSKLLVRFDVSLRSVHFLGATEQAQALREAWARTEAAVEEQVRAALVKKEEKKAAAEVRMQEEGEWRKVVDSWLFVAGGRGEEGRGESEEEEKVCGEGACDEEEDDDDDENKKEDEEEENENEEEKNGEREEVRAGGQDEGERRRRENTGGREAKGEEEEAGQAEDDDEGVDGDGFEEEDDEMDEGEEEEGIEVKGA